MSFKINTTNIKTFDDCQRAFQNIKNEFNKDIIVDNSVEQVIVKIFQDNYTTKWNGVIDSNIGRYYKIGKLCFFEGTFRIATVGTTGTTNSVYIELPLLPLEYDYDLMKKNVNKIVEYNPFCIGIGRVYDRDGVGYLPAVLRTSVYKGSNYKKGFVSITVTDLSRLTFNELTLDDSLIFSITYLTEE